MPTSETQRSETGAIHLHAHTTSSHQLAGPRTLDVRWTAGPKWPPPRNNQASANAEASQAAAISRVISARDPRHRVVSSAPPSLPPDSRSASLGLSPPLPNVRAGRVRLVPARAGRDGRCPITHSRAFVRASAPHPCIGRTGRSSRRSRSAALPGGLSPWLDQSRGASAAASCLSMGVRELRAACCRSR